MEERTLPAVPDHLAPGLDIVFIGYNPSLLSSETGHHYANPNNRFWKMLHGAGFTARLYAPREDADLLAQGFGFTNIVARPTRAAADIAPEEYDEGRALLLRKLQTYRPRAACFVGRGVYERYAGRKTKEWGFQPDHLSLVRGMREFVGPSTSGLVRMTLDELIRVYRELARWNTGR